MAEIKKYPLKLVENKKEQKEIIETVASCCAWILPFLKLTAERLKRRRKFKCFKSNSYPDFDATLSGERTKMLVIQVSKNRLVALTDWVGEDMYSGFTEFRQEVFVFVGYSLEDLTEKTINRLIESPRVRICADHSWDFEKPSNKCLSCKLDIPMTDRYSWKLMDYIRQF